MLCFGFWPNRHCVPLSLPTHRALVDRLHFGWIYYQTDIFFWHSTKHTWAGFFCLFATFLHFFVALSGLTLLWAVFTFPWFVLGTRYETQQIEIPSVGSKICIFSIYAIYGHSYPMCHKSRAIKTHLSWLLLLVRHIFSLLRGIEWLVASLRSLHISFVSRIVFAERTILPRFSLRLLRLRVGIVGARELTTILHDKETTYCMHVVGSHPQRNNVLLLERTLISHHHAHLCVVLGRHRRAWNTSCKRSVTQTSQMRDADVSIFVCVRVCERVGGGKFEAKRRLWWKSGTAPYGMRSARLHYVVRVKSRLAL